MRKAYLITAVIFIIFSVVALYFANELPDSRRGTPGHAVWPILISCAMFFSGFILFINTFKNKKMKYLDILTNDNVRVYITMVVLIIYFICMNVIGFVVSSLVLTFGLFTWYGNFPFLQRILFSIAIVGVVYSVFNFALSVPFRFGILF